MEKQGFASQKSLLRIKNRGNVEKTGFGRLSLGQSGLKILSHGHMPFGELSASSMMDRDHLLVEITHPA